MFKITHNNNTIETPIFFNGGEVYVEYKNGLFTPINLPTEEIEVEFLGDTNFAMNITFKAQVGQYPDLKTVSNVFFGNQRSKKEAYVLENDTLVPLTDIDSIYIYVGDREFEFCSACNGTGNEDEEICLDCGGDGILF